MTSAGGSAPLRGGQIASSSSRSGRASSPAMEVVGDTSIPRCRGGSCGLVHSPRRRLVTWRRPCSAPSPLPRGGGRLPGPAPDQRNPPGQLRPASSCFAGGTRRCPQGPASSDQRTPPGRLRPASSASWDGPAPESLDPARRCSWQGAAVPTGCSRPGTSASVAGPRPWLDLARPLARPCP